MQLEFCDPPPLSMGGTGRRNNARLIEVAELLRQRPGQWAKWPFDTASPYVVAGNIKQGRYASFPSEEFDTMVRGRQMYIRAKAA